MKYLRFIHTSVGNVAAGKTIPLCDGLYDFTFKKSNGTRADIFVNGNMVGQNVDQYGKGRELQVLLTQLRMLRLKAAVRL